MKRKYIRVILLVGILVVLLSLSGIYAINMINYSNKISEMGDGFVMEGSLLEQIEKEGQTQSAEVSITKSYSEDMVGYLGITKRGEILNLSHPPRSLYAINNEFPVEYLQTVNSELIYVVYSIDPDEGQPYYMYCFFQKLDSKLENAEEGTELWWLSGRVLFACKTLSYEDFKTIQVGSTMSEVAEIDPMAEVYRPNEVEPYIKDSYDEEAGEYVEHVVTPDPVLSCEAYHYLTDGILCITYSRDGAGQEFTVSEIKYNDSYEMDASQGQKIDAQIQSEDFPGE